MYIMRLNIYTNKNNLKQKVIPPSYEVLSKGRTKGTEEGMQTIKSQKIKFS